MISKRAAEVDTAVTGLASSEPHGTGGAASRLGLISGLLLFGLEAIQGLALPFLIRAALGTSMAAGWVVLMSSAGLVGLACSAQGQALVRSISRLQPGAGAVTGLPANWVQIGTALRLRQGLVLLAAQAGFLVVGRSLFVDLGPSAVGVIALVFVAQHLRLLAFANFTALNGLRRVGLDKALQAAASAATLLLSLLALWLLPSVLAVAVVPVLTHAVLWLASAQVLRRACVLDRSVALAGRSEASGLLLLAVAGYLSTNSDVLLSSNLLPAHAQFQFGVIARALLVPVAIVGLWSHLRFPHWCAPELSLGAGLRDVARLGALLGAALVLLLVLAASLAPQVGTAGFFELPVWMVAVMTLNAFLASMTAAVGQVLLAKRFLSFVWPTIVLAMAAPALALLWAGWFGAHAFVLGYSASSLSVLFVLGLCIRWRPLDAPAARGA